MEKGLLQTWQFGPILVEDGDIKAIDRTLLAPRTAFGYYEPGHYVFLTAVGRASYAPGLAHAQTVEIMKNLGGNTHLILMAAIARICFSKGTGSWRQRFLINGQAEKIWTGAQ